MDINVGMLEKLIREIVVQQLAGKADFIRDIAPQGVMSVKLDTVKVGEENRLDTGNKDDIVYTKDLFTLEESPRLGCGIMEMKETTFAWELGYDEIDYVIEGELSIISEDKVVTAKAGELILIPKNSKIQFSVPNYARFIYVTYPADWSS
ncbi:MAG: ethanolamine utilization protein EutQ [Epulopiscium sp. Nuni2H_MBin003]|nr:MAG: ethanolamine utilization protein EutQ [Epulopiscium sp. Nuni2H_MBin003]